MKDVDKRAFCTTIMSHWYRSTTHALHNQLCACACVCVCVYATPMKSENSIGRQFGGNCTNTRRYWDSIYDRSKRETETFVVQMDWREKRAKNAEAHVVTWSHLTMECAAIWPIIVHQIVTVSESDNVTIAKGKKRPVLFDYKLGSTVRNGWMLVLSTADASNVQFIHIWKIGTDRMYIIRNRSSSSFIRASIGIRLKQSHAVRMAGVFPCVCVRAHALVKLSNATTTTTTTATKKNGMRQNMSFAIDWHRDLQQHTALSHRTDLNNSIMIYGTRWPNCL